MMNDDDAVVPLGDDDILAGASAGDGGSGDDGSGQDFGGEETLVTKEGLKKLKEELEHLKTTRRKEVAQRLKEAISYGDLSENSEYEEAKNEQAFVEGRIIELEEKIKSAKIISEKKVTSSASGKEVTIGSTVTVQSTRGGEPETYTIVGATEADPFEQKISNESPIGKSLLTRRKGDTVKVVTPAGTMEYDVLKVA